MAYNIDGLSPAGAQSKAGDAPQMWTYKSADAKATVAAGVVDVSAGTDISVA